MRLRRSILAAAVVVFAASTTMAAPPQSTDGQSRRVRIHNQTGLEVRTLRAADVRTGEFGDDLLAGTPLAAGTQRMVLIDDGRGGCLYDLSAQLGSGQTVLKENVNVCRLADYFLTR